MAHLAWRTRVGARLLVRTGIRALGGGDVVCVEVGGEEGKRDGLTSTRLGQPRSHHHHALATAAASAMPPFSMKAPHGLSLSQHSRVAMRPTQSEDSVNVSSNSASKSRLRHACSARCFPFATPQRVLVPPPVTFACFPPSFAIACYSIEPSIHP